VDVEDFDFGWHQGTLLSDMQARFAEADQKSVDFESGSNTRSDRKASAHRSEIYTGNWKAHDLRVIKLAATVIFCVVVAVCLGQSIRCHLLQLI
jgi:hypothetical protein